MSWLLSLLFIFVVPHAATASDSIPVYKAPRANSEAIYHLKNLDSVRMSSKNYGGFRKVLFLVKGKKTYGFIRKDRFETLDPVVQSKNKPYSQMSGFGVAAVYSFLHRGEFSITTSEGFDYDISAFNSSSFFFDVFYDHSFSEKWQGQLALTFRQTSYTGQAQLKLGATSNLDITLKESLIGGRVILRRYAKPSSHHWYGFGGELANGSSVDLKIGDVKVKTEDEEKPFYMTLIGATGWNFHLSGAFYILTEARLLVVANADPLIYGFDSSAAIAYAF